MTATLFLGAALICLGPDCWPALVGRDTPVGEFPLTRRYVSARGYGGDVMQFAEDANGIYAVHRVWLGRPAERRAERLASGRAADRRHVTNGCVNVAPEVYDRVVAAERLVVKP